MGYEVHLSLEQLLGYLKFVLLIYDEKMLKYVANIGDK